MEIVFVRHGATEWNLRHRLQGGTDRALSETGENQALALRKAIAFLAPQLCFTSELLRARKTAHLLGYETPIYLSLLNEMNLGEWEGLTLGEIHELWSLDDYQAWRRGDFVPPKAETFAHFDTRIMSALSKIYGASREARADRALVVAHGGVFRSLARRLFDLNPMVFSAVDPGSLSIFSLDRDDAGALSAQLIRYNWVPLSEDG